MGLGDGSDGNGVCDASVRPRGNEGTKEVSIHIIVVHVVGAGHKIDLDLQRKSDGFFLRFLKLSAPRWAPNCFGQKMHQRIFFVDLWNQ